VDQPGDVLDIGRVPPYDQRRDVLIDRGGDRRVALGEGGAAKPVKARFGRIHSHYHQGQALRCGYNGADAGYFQAVAGSPRRLRLRQASVGIEYLTRVLSGHLPQTTSIWCVRLLVTGAAGQLGREVAAQLTSSGWRVRAHDRVPADPALAEEVVVGDLSDPVQAAALVEGMDAVVHAAAIPSPKGAPEPEIFTNNVQSAYHVLDAAGRSGVPRIVYVSSLSALGLAWSRFDLSPEVFPVPETHPYVGDDVYGLSKYLSELIAETVARRWDSTVVSLRFPFLGSGDRLTAHLDKIHGDPGLDRKSLWGWLDTRDAARAVEAALTRPLTGHHVINVVAQDTSALEPTAELLRRYHPATRLTEPPAGFGTVFSTQRSRELLGFTAIHSWRDHPRQ
jgi:nucleoside-diphosphate-sugar epimerase